MMQRHSTPHRTAQKSLSLLCVSWTVPPPHTHSPPHLVGTRLSPAIPAEIVVSFQIATQSGCVTNGNTGNLACSSQCC